MVDLLTEIHVNAIEGKAMDELMDSSRKNRPPLRKPCMEGTRNDILQAIEIQCQKYRRPQYDLDKGISWCWEICLGS